MSSDFNTLFKTLNSAQQQAVEAIEGPVMVIAGPGTGKTQILATRILNILDKTDALPEDILCLTYTEAGTAAMRQRLSRFMGADAYRVNIHTFHGLCNRIIQEHPEKFSQRELRVMDDLEKLELMDALIREIPATEPIKNYQEDPANLRHQLGNLFKLMQEESYTTEIFTSLVSQLTDEENFIATFPEYVYKTTTKWGAAGSIKRAKYDELIRDWNKLISASKLFEKYQLRKKEFGIYEFSDMIHWVVDAMHLDAELLSIYQEKFQYILVDEYQDTSGVQNTIVYKLIEFWDDNPNCFVVGDDDQSIYAFQGARVSNMLEFAHKYSANLKTIVLTENYRSTQIILDAAKKLISNNSGRLIYQIEGLSKELTAAGENNVSNASNIEFLHYRNRFHEAYGISDKIKSIYASGTPYNEIAVIYAKHAWADELADVLRLNAVPFMLAKSVNILAEPMINKLCNWLQYLALELEMPHKGEHLLYNLLHTDLYAISPYEVASISVEIYKRKKEDLKWRDFLAEYAKNPQQNNLFEGEKRAALRSLWKNVEHWLKNAANMNVPQLVQEIIANGGFLAGALKSDEREWLMEQLHTFMNYVNTMNQRRPFLTLGECMEDLEKMRKNSIAIPLEKRIGSHNGVTLTTAHSSKGLEFKHVIIIGAEQEAWEKDRANAYPFKLGKLFQTFNQNHAHEMEEEDNSEERRRLFYVALTRAKSALTVSYTGKKIDAKGTALHPSKFLVEITDGAVFDEIEIPKSDLLVAEEKLLANVSPPVVEVLETNWLRKQVEGFKFSPSTLYDILDCGLKFYFGRIVRVPSAPSASLGYGLAVHDTLSRLMDEGVNKKNWPDEKTFVGWFEYEMFRKRSSFTQISYETRLQQGRDQLPKYYKLRVDEFKQYQAIILERWLETSIDGVIVGGKTDKLVFNGNDVTIVDYKTGNSKNAEKNFKAPSAKSIEERKLPSKYWFQLGIYMLIIGNQTGKDWRPSLAVIDSLERNDDGEFPVFKQTYSTEELDYLKYFLKEGNRKLQSFEFLKGCGKTDCEWCQFTKETGQMVKLPEIEN